jgi:hypothetical protein
MRRDSVPCTFILRFDGKLWQTMTLRNVLNPSDVHVISIKRTVVRRYNFLIDPAEITFGDVTVGSSSKGAWS